MRDTVPYKNVNARLNNELPSSAKANKKLTKRYTSDRASGFLA